MKKIFSWIVIGIAMMVPFFALWTIGAICTALIVRYGEWAISLLVQIF